MAGVYIILVNVYYAYRSQTVLYKSHFLLAKVTVPLIPLDLDSGFAVGGVACELRAHDLDCDEVAIDAGTLAFFWAGTAFRNDALPSTIIALT